MYDIVVQLFLFLRQTLYCYDGMSTSEESVLEGDSIEYAETVTGAEREATAVLVEASVEDLLLRDMTGSTWKK